MIESIDTPFKWALLGRPPMTRWAEGRVCLLGDACHPTLPFLAQGANMAIEDGFVMARCLEAERGNPAAGFRRFERARMERTARVVRGSAENTRRFHNAVLADRMAAPDYMRREMAPEKLRTRYDWAYEYDARTVPV